MTRHALLLSGSLGMGHDVVAEACARSLADRGWTTDTQDAMHMLGGSGVNALGELVFRRALAVPFVYDGLHFSSLRTGNALARWLNRTASRRTADAVRALLDEQRPDLVVSVFATAAGAMDLLRRERAAPPTVVLCTDACAHAMWVHPGTDLFLVTSEVAASSVRRFRPDADVIVVPAPVRPPFYDPPSQDAARAMYAVPVGEPCVLLMSGAWGIGALAQVAEALAGAGVHVLAVAGRNEKLRVALRAVAARQPRVRPFGYTDRVAELMAAADLVITSSGDTCTEARVLGRPLLLLDTLPGHGRDNLQHQLELGEAEVTSDEPRLVCAHALAMLARARRPLPRVVGTAAAWEQALDAALAHLGLS